ncbi:MAG: hypothetical protein PHX93_00220 [Candidatus Peribacteraceae bacterium]|jgi:hypothetical protein|nr:hypothetical protein [Candidatus Peribacteraceae bacterium]
MEKDRDQEAPEIAVGRVAYEAHTLSQLADSVSVIAHRGGLPAGIPEGTFGEMEEQLRAMTEKLHSFFRPENTA